MVLFTQKKAKKSGRISQIDLYWDDNNGRENKPMKPKSVRKPGFNDAN